MKTKVKNVENYYNSNGIRIVIKGIIHLKRNLKPIAITAKNDSEVTLGDSSFIYSQDASKRILAIRTGLDINLHTKYNGQKIIAFPKNFSKKLLTDIEKGLVKDGDEIYVECSYVNKECFAPGGDRNCTAPKCNCSDFEIKLTTKKNIKTWPIL